MKFLVKSLLVVICALMLLPASALAITRTDALKITTTHAYHAARCNAGWHCSGLVANVSGPQGGSIQWVGGFIVHRNQGSYKQTCIGSIDIGPYGGVHNPLINCYSGPLTTRDAGSWS